LGYFGPVQNLLKTEGNLKIIAVRYKNAESIINHKGTSIGMDGEDLEHR